MYFSEGSTDAILASSLRDGDVVLVNRRCSSLGNPLAAALCLASKYGLSGEGRHCWDHAAVVVREAGVPYLLEGGRSGVTMRTYEERLLQSTDHQEVLLLPLRTTSDGSGSATAAEEARRSRILGTLVADVGLRRTPDGRDAPGATCCQNTWSTYRALRQPYSKRGIGRPASASATTAARAEDTCTFGAPLVATALQRLGVLDGRVDAASVTPASLPSLPLEKEAYFGRPVPVRSLND